MDKLDLRAVVTDALRYWERRRILYNFVLLLVVTAVYVVRLPLSRQLLSSDLVLQFFMLAVGANVAYCAAYPVDLLVQFSTLRDSWLRVRWVLLLIGCLFAATLAQFMARGILGGVP